MLNITIGKRIRECRQKRELTQEKLADCLNVSHQLISKWENGITTPDVGILFSFSQLFGVSIDYLCGAEKSDAEALTADIIGKYPYENIPDYDVLNEKYALLESEVKTFPLNEELLAYSLKYLRSMHDFIRTDEQKESVNERISLTAQRLLDISKDDDRRSLANYNLAVYFLEQTSLLKPSPEQKENARKAREYADKVLYKDMHKAYYNLFGVQNETESREAWEKTLGETAVELTRAVRNLSRHYRRENMTKELDRLNSFSDAFTETKKLLTR